MDPVKILEGRGGVAREFYSKFGARGWTAHMPSAAALITFGGRIIICCFVQEMKNVLTVRAITILFMLWRPGIYGSSITWFCLVDVVTVMMDKYLW